MRFTVARLGPSTAGGGCHALGPRGSHDLRWDRTAVFASRSECDGGVRHDLALNGAWCERAPRVRAARKARYLASHLAADARGDVARDVSRTLRDVTDGARDDEDEIDENENIDGIRAPPVSSRVDARRARAFARTRAHTHNSI